MKKGLMAMVVIIVVALIIVTSIIGTYNGLVEMNENVDAKWSQVENNLQRRSDLIPNLVATVKGYAKHEEDLFTDIADARARLGGGGSISDMSKANDELSGALSRLLVVVENYPQLKADKNFIQLMDNLEGTENRLAIARKDYNDAVQRFNASIKKFPAALIASMLGYEKRDYFEADEGSKQVPLVSF